MFFFEKSFTERCENFPQIWNYYRSCVFSILFIAIQEPNENCFMSVWICVNPKSIFVMRILRLYARNNIGNKFSGISIRLRFIDRHINVYMCNETNEIGLLLVAAILRLYVSNKRRRLLEAQANVARKRQLRRRYYSSDIFPR